MKYLFKFLFSFVIIFILLSCEEKNKIRQQKYSYCYQGIIDNLELSNNLRDYFIKYVSNIGTEKVLVLDSYQIQDTNVFIISYEMNLYNLLRTQPLILLKVDSINVIMRTNADSFIKIETDYQKDMLRQIFPSQFHEFELYGEAPPPTTYHCDKWILKFVEDKLVKKEIN